MLVETLHIAAKEAAEVTKKVAVAAKEIKELPETIGEMSKLDLLVEEIGEELSELALLPEEIADSLSNVESDKIKPEKKGGSYGEVYKKGEGSTTEVHHIPADSSSPLERKDGPAIKMEKKDHEQTTSYGSSKEAQEYREAQKELIEQGKFEEAVQMDIDDIHERFGDKYDDAIAEMQEYIEKIKAEGKI